METVSVESAYVGAAENELHARHAATRLRNVLRLNSEFSILTGVAAVSVGGPVADVLGIDQAWLVRMVGLCLLGFAVVVFTVAGSRTSVLRRLSLEVSIADFVWVGATALVLPFGWFSTAGSIVMTGIALVVFALGAEQLRSRRRLNAAIVETTADLEEFPPVEVVWMSRSTAIGADDLWRIMTDHELYASLALNLKAARGLTPNGPGFRRTCTDSAGRSWSETCTLWDEGRRFDVDVDTSDYPYPLHVMQGSWRVEPTNAGSEVAMAFAFQPTPGPRGRVFVPLMHATFPPILRRIVRGWANAAS